MDRTKPFRLLSSPTVRSTRVLTGSLLHHNTFGWVYYNTSIQVWVERGESLRSLVTAFCTGSQSNESVLSAASEEAPGCYRLTAKNELVWQTQSFAPSSNNDTCGLRCYLFWGRWTGAHYGKSLSFHALRRRWGFDRSLNTGDRGVRFIPLDQECSNIWLRGLCRDATFQPSVWVWYNFIQHGGYRVASLRVWTAAKRWDRRIRAWTGTLWYQWDRVAQVLLLGDGKVFLKARGCQRSCNQLWISEQLRPPFGHTQFICPSWSSDSTSRPSSLKSLRIPRLLDGDRLTPEPRMRASPIDLPCPFRRKPTRWRPCSK